MGDLDNTNVVIVVFAMDGCGACEEYLPKLLAQVEAYQKLGHPFVVYELGMRLQPGQIPVCIYDAQSEDPSVVAFADQHNVTGLPTTLLLPKRGKGQKWEGGLDATGIYGVLNLASQANR